MNFIKKILHTASLIAIITLPLLFISCPDPIPPMLSYSITYDGNGNTGGYAPLDPMTYHANDTITVLGNTGSLTKTGYSFVGWNTLADGSGTDRAASSTFKLGSADVTLHAKWTAQPTYTVTYNGNGNTGGSVPIGITNYLADATVTVSTNTGSLIKTGYSFEGWNTLADGTGTDRAESSTFTMGSANATLYAKWTALPISGYSLTFDPNGATGGTVPSSGVYPRGYTYFTYGFNNPGNLSKTGFSFGGWNTQPDGTGTVISFPLELQSSMVLYATWFPMYSIVYYGNGNTRGTPPIDPTLYLPGTFARILGNSGSLEKNGYYFAGWNTKPDSTGNFYSTPAIFFGLTSDDIYDGLTMSNSNLDLYAYWLPAVSDFESTNVGKLKGIPGASIFNYDRSLNRTIPSFHISSKEITQAQYLSVMGSNPSNYTGDLSRPVENVSFCDAIVFCNKLSIREGLTPVYSVISLWPNNLGKDPTNWGTMPWHFLVDSSANGYRLPTVDEWDWAKIGSFPLSFFVWDSLRDFKWAGYNSLASLPDFVWFLDNSNSTTHPVGMKMPNEWGLFDMNGNVGEFVFGTSAGEMGNGDDSDRYVKVLGGDITWESYWFERAYTGSILGYEVRSTVGFRVARN